MPSESPRPGVATVLRELAANRDLRGLQLASLAWGSAEAAALVGLTIVLYREGGTGAVALLAVVRALPSVVIAPVLTAAAERIPAGTQLRAVLATRLLLAVLLTAALMLGAGSAPVLVLAGVDAIASTLLRPIRGALAPALARSPEELVAANVATTTGDSVAALVGPALAAGLLIVAGHIATVGAGGVLFAVAAALALSIHSAEPAAADPGPATRSQRRDRSGFLAGLRDLAGNRHARLIAALFVAQRFVRGMLAVLVVSSALELLRLGEPGVGLLGSAIGLGGFIGGGLALGLVSRSRLVPAFAIGILAWGAGVAAPGLAPVAALAAISFALAGTGKVILDVAGFSLLQRTVPAAERGRVLGALEGLVTGALAAGPIAAAWLLGVVGPAGALVVAGAIPLLAAAIAWLPLRTADDAAVIPARELRLLRRVPLFRPLGLNSLERLAGAIAWRAVEPGRAVVREHERGDRFYVIEAGAFDVTRAGAPLRAMGPGESFGEIALLRAMPRTATVTATSDGSLAAIDSESFLAVVNGNPASAAAAEAQACDRLLSRLA